MRGDPRKWAEKGRILSFRTLRGESALAAVYEASGKIALLITDVYLGRMNGIELARAVRAAYPAIPVIFMSSAAPAETLPCEVPTSAFILKPLYGQKTKPWGRTTWPR